MSVWSVYVKVLDDWAVTVVAGSKSAASRAGKRMVREHLKDGGGIEDLTFSAHVYGTAGSLPLVCRRCKGSGVEPEKTVNR